MELILRISLERLRFGAVIGSVVAKLACVLAKGITGTDSEMLSSRANYFVV